MSDYVVPWTDEKYALALRQRAGAKAALIAETRKLKAATERLAVAEDALIKVWQWTHDGHPELELLLPILNAAASEAGLLAALDELQEQDA